MRPLTRFSFLPGNLYQELFFPLTLPNNKPALYVDATEINRKDIYILTINDNHELVSPIRLNLKIPPSCKAMNPSPMQSLWGFTLFCENNKRWYLHFIPIKFD
jgi:hypothetical protein